METCPAGDPAVCLGEMRILVVEDEAFVAMLLEDELMDAGAKVLGTAASVDDALRMLDVALADGGIDLGVLDLNLGGESAVPVADAFARHAVPFVVITGYEGVRASGDHVSVPTLHKPFAAGDLIATVAAAAGRRVRA